MLEKVLQSILRRYFGQFITGLENVQLAFWTGKINIQNASFRHQKINELLKVHNLPLSIKFSYLGSLELDVPWNKLSSAPVQIKLTNVYIVFSLQKFAQSSQKLQSLQQNAKYILIKNYVSYILKKSQQLNNDNQNQQGFLKKLLVKILHNVNLQVNNIHIRIENSKPGNIINEPGEGEEDKFYSFAGEDNKPCGFSLGFCIQNIEAETINEKNQKQYVQIQNGKTPIRKSISLRQISFYWQQASTLNLLDYSTQKKIEHLRSIISRPKHRLLTIDGTLLMQKNKQNFDYFFSTSFRVLQIKTNYQQLKQIIQVTQSFVNEKSKKKIIKLKELKHQAQLKLEPNFKTYFTDLYQTKFQKVTEEAIKLIQSVEKKLLMKWTRDLTIQLIKLQKLKTAVQIKNKRGWLSFLSKNSNLPLTEQQIKQIQHQINKFIEVVDKNTSKLSLALYIFIRSFHVLMEHQKVKQKLYLIADEIELQHERKQNNWKVGLHILDAGLTYKDSEKLSEVAIFRKNAQNKAKLIQLQLQNTPRQQKLDLLIESVGITHEIQFLGFISEMINLQQRQQVKSKMALLNAQVLHKRTQQSQLSPNPIQKVYDYRVRLKKMQIKIQLDSKTQLYGYIEGINIQRDHKETNTHTAQLLNLGIAYLNSNAYQKTYKIIQDINIVIHLTRLKVLRSSIPKIKVVLNEESLYSIGSCLKHQIKLLKLRKKQYKHQLIQQQEKFMEGETEIINVFKSLKTYHTILTRDSLLFCEKEANNKVDFSSPAKKILLQNMTITRCDELSLKLQSVIINEIIHCKSKEDTNQWLYHIEQRIFENSTKQQIFTMLDQQAEQQDQPRIYIPYDSTIDLTLHTFELIYEKNSRDKILSLQLNHLNVLLKQNNLQFERRVYLQQINLKNLTLTQQHRDEYNTILSNTLNYFQDPNSDSQQQKRNQNISVLIQGKKKTHPKYTGQISITSHINKLFLNYDAEFIFNILYRLTYGEQVAKPYPETLRNAKIIQILKEVLEVSNGIPQKYQNAQPFQFSRSFVQLQKYKQLYSCHVLFHVQLTVEEIQINCINGRNNLWMDKLAVDSLTMQVDKSTDFLFVKGRIKDLSISDLTGYPHTIQVPFTQAEPYPLVSTQTQRKEQNAAEFYAGLFEPLVFINKQRFKNYFVLNLSDLLINYQQQPLMRFIDYFTNQIILFGLQPFGLHKYDTPFRGSYSFGTCNYTEQEIRKILYDSLYPFFTHLRIQINRLALNLNTHPHQEGLLFRIPEIKIVSSPYINNQRTHVRLDLLKKFQQQYKTLEEIRQKWDKQSYFQNLVTKFQWATRYLITAREVTCDIFESDFNYQMYFQRANNGDKDLLLPFLMIDKDLFMEGRIKHLGITASKRIYNLINKCLNFNMSFDDKYDKHFIANHQFQHLNPPTKLIFRLLLGQLNFIIPQLNRTVFVIQNCQYTFAREKDNTKVMDIRGNNLHIFISQHNYLIKPINLDQEKGFTYKILMHPSGEKEMAVTISHIDLLLYQQDYMMQLIKYFAIDDACCPKQDTYDDLPLIKCQAQLKNSYYRIAQNSQFIYTLKGNTKITWTRNKNIHPQHYKHNKQLYPNNSQASSYDIQLKGVTLRKYTKTLYAHKESNYRALSLPMHCKAKLANIMKANGEVFYSTMIGDYQIEQVCLKLCYKDIIELQESLSKPANQNPQRPELPLGYTPQSNHNFNIDKLSLQFGLSELPVPLVNFALESSTIKIQLIGNTKILTNKLEPTLEYWNVLIGRWQPVLERSFFELTLRLGRQNYYSISSTRPILLNFSTESLKVLKLISKDIGEGGNLKIFSGEGNNRGMQVSPYVITNRTGHTLFILNHHLDPKNDKHSHKSLKNNDTMHIQIKTSDLDQKIEVVKYKIDGDDFTIHEINFTQVDTKHMIQYREEQYTLILDVISSPILKEIVISSPYVIHNKTSYNLIFTLDQNQYLAEPDKKVAIPFTETIHKDKVFKLDFLHLTNVRENYRFTFEDIHRGYEHYAIYEENELFNCLVQLQTTHENVISVSPLTTFINLLPLDIKMQIALIKPKGSRVVIQQVIQVNKQKVLYQFGSKDIVSVRIKFKGFNYSSFQNMNLPQDHQSKGKYEDKVIFVDHRGIESYIKSTVIKKNKKKMIYLYSENILINQSNYPIYFFGQSQLLAGQRINNIPQSQSKFIIINEVENPAIGFKQDDPSQAVKFSLQQLGNQSLLVSHNDHLYELTVNSSVHCLDQQLKIFTRIIKVTPSYIIQNKCTRGICFRQVNTDQRFYMKINELTDWNWHSKDQPRQLAISASDNQFQLPEGWDFSAPIEPQHLEETVLVLRPNGRGSHKLLIKIELFKQTQFTYIVFKQLRNPQDSLLTFKNSMHLVHLQIHQKFLQDINPPWSNHKHFSCPPMSQTLFGWDYPNEDHIINVQFDFQGPYRMRYHNDMVSIDLSKLTKPVIVQFKGDEGELLEVEVSLQFVGIRRKIIFQSRDQSQASRLVQQQLLQESTGNKMGLSLSQIGISVIGGKQPRCQIIFISIKKLQLIMMQKQYKRNFQLKIKYINIDNNLYHNTIYPVLFTPLKQRKTLQKTRPFFICLIEQNLKSKQIMQINYFRMAIEPISFKLYDQIISKLYDMQKEFNSVGEKEKKIDLCQLYRSYIDTLEWLQKEPSSKDKSIFIREIQIGKLIIQLSFSIKPTSGGNIIIYTIVTLFRTALSNVSQSQIKLSRFNRRNISMGDLTNQLSEFYRKEIYKEIYKIPGSINILGNPYVFFKYIAEGVWEIINQPSQGFIKGPIEGAIGVVKGGVYFVRNVVAGTCNSFQVISESCSQGISYVTFDEKFITRREKIQMQKSKHIVDGTKSALFALYTGVEVAVTGLYRHPKESLEKKEGAGGFMKGMLIGVAGLFTKPLSGMFEGISKFSEGIKQTALFFQDRPNTTRSRPPRVFIGQHQYYIDYNIEQCKAINLLEFHSTKHLKKTVMIVSVDPSPEDNDTIYTVLTNVYLVLLSKSKKKILREIRVQDISQVEIINPRQLKLKSSHDQMVIPTHKCKQFYECFRIAFEHLQKNQQDGDVDSR